MYTIEVPHMNCANIKDDYLYISDTNGVYSCGHKIELPHMDCANANKLSFQQKGILKHLMDKIYLKEFNND